MSGPAGGGPSPGRGRRRNDEAVGRDATRDAALRGAGAGAGDGHGPQDTSAGGAQGGRMDARVSAGPPDPAAPAPVAAWSELPPDRVVRVRVDDPELTIDVDPFDEPAGDLAGTLIRPLPARADGPGGVAQALDPRLEVVVDGWRFELSLEPARRAILRERATRAASGARAGPDVVRAPLPGRVGRIWVAPGDQVERGQRLCSLEAMKMENEVVARRAGTIARVSVEPGARVEQGDELVVIG